MDTKLDLQSLEESDLRLIEAFIGREPYVKVMNEAGVVEIIPWRPVEISVLRTRIDGDFLIAHTEEKILKIRIYPGTRYETGPSGARIYTPWDTLRDSRPH